MPGGGSLQDPTIAEAMDPLVGTTMGRYTILDRVAKGGTATVYRALDNVLNREVAVKVLHEHLGGKREVVIRFKNEAQVIAQLRHQNILTVFDFFEFEGRAVLVVEYMPGVTLSTLIKQVARIPEDFVLMIGLEMLQGLRVAHQKGITHRDIKPANILLHPDLGIKISDFGLAKLVNADDGLTKEGIFVGTPSFSSPEQIEGKPLDQRSDLFSLGLTLYILATRSHAFKQQGDSTTTVWFKIVKGKFESLREKNPDLSPEFERIINRSLEVDLQKRYQTASEMISDIETLMRARGLMPYDEPLKEFLRAPDQAKNIARSKDSDSRNAKLIWGLSLGFFLIALWVGGILFQKRVAEERNPKNDVGLQTAPDARVDREVETPAAAPTPIVTTPEASKPKPITPLRPVDLAEGVYRGSQGLELKRFEKESFETYRNRTRSKKIPLVVSSRFGDVDIEMNPFTQDLRLDWQLGTEAASYRLEVSTDSKMKAPLFTGGMPTKSMTLERLWEKSQTLYWRVSYLDESNNVFLIDPIRRINLKLKGAPNYFEMIVPQAGDQMRSNSLQVKAFGPQSGFLRCATITRTKNQANWLEATKDEATFIVSLRLPQDVASILCEAKMDSKNIIYFSIPVSFR